MKAYPRHNKRSLQILDGTWDFSFLGKDVSLEKILIDEIDFNDKMVVPASIDSSPAYAGTNGTFAYRTQIKTTPGLLSRIRFNGLGMWCRVYVDGNEICESSLPYTGFWVDVSSSAEELRELVVIIDNRFDDIRVPLQKDYFDFYAYGGIFRTVEWHEYENFCIERAQIKTDGDNINAKIIFHGKVPENIDLEILLDDGAAEIFSGIDIKNNIAEINLSSPGLESWSPDAPHLHTIKISSENDDIIERFGVRKLKIEDRKIMLNDKPLKLLGYCRHEAHPQFGPALPHQQLLNDLQMLKDLGCNFVRGAHYAQDQRFLDLCDELGFLVMEESLAWQPQIEDFLNPKFCDLQEEQTRLMVKNSINHPSVIIWAFFNEGISDVEESKHIYTRLADCIRDEDSTRFVSYASNHSFGDLNFDLVDIICVNMYPGWYCQTSVTEPLSEIIPFINEVMDSLKDRGLNDKPFIISEIGAGAIYGWRDSHDTPWSESFQEKYLEVVCKEIIGNEKISGVALWQFCDCRTYSNSGALGRPRAFNNKGTVDEYRRPKVAYETVKRIFNSFNNE